MGRKSSMTETDYLALVAAFKEVGGKNVAAVSRTTGKCRRLVTEMWDEGKPELGMPPISQKLGITSTSVGSNSVPASAALTSIADKKTSEAGTGPTPATDSPITPSPGVVATPTNGFTAKQQAARQQEEVAILSMIQNLVGASITLTSITQLINQQVPLVSQIQDAAEKRVLLKELGALMIQVGKVAAVLTDGIPRVMAAARLNTGQAGAITELHHTGTVQIETGPNTELAAERQRRYDHLVDMALRARTYVPGAYQGEESGIVDAEVTEAVEEAPVSSPLQEGVRALTIRQEPPTPTPEEAEQRLRVALAARGMPALQIDRVLERTKARCQELARSMSDMVDEVLATPPGQAN